VKSVGFDSDEAPIEPNYAQAVGVDEARRLLFVSGQIPMRADGHVAPDFSAQAEQVWTNVDAQLRAAGMTRDNLVKVTTFLADRRHAAENRRIRDVYLASRRIALTVIITGIFDEAWLLEIEAIAVA
jgi:2-iminobutanoate/2-iminopropanoate deaminase